MNGRLPGTLDSITSVQGETFRYPEANDATMTFTIRMWPGQFGVFNAREAAALIKALGKQDARVEIERVTTGQRSTGNSLLSLIGLGLRDRDLVRVSADGPDADEAVATAVHALKERGAFGGSVDSLGPDPTPEAMLAFHERAVWLAEWFGRQFAPVRRCHRTRRQRSYVCESSNVRRSPGGRLLVTSG
jgi:phosphotransferase system HPr-like phosphotransfer protein